MHKKARLALKRGAFWVLDEGRPRVAFNDFPEARDKGFADLVRFAPRCINQKCCKGGWIVFKSKKKAWGNTKNN